MSEVLLRFVHISDTHIHPDERYALQPGQPSPAAGARALVEQINALPFTPDFVLHTGDVAYDPDPSAYHAAREILGGIRYPVYYIPGNHDHPEGLQQVLLGREQPLLPMLYEFERSGVQVVCVDSTGPAPAPAGNVTQEQILRLTEICGSTDDDRPLVIAVHHNVLPVGVPWLDHWMGLINGVQFHQTLLNARQRIRGVFFGHVHQNLTIMQDGILYASVLSSWYQLHAYPGQTDTQEDRGAEPGFNVVTISKDQTFIRHHRF